jgi:putative ABC transport system permease protein
MPYPERPESWRRYFTFWRPNIRRDIDAELRFHFDARIGELIAQGMDADAARTQALEEFGDVNDTQRDLHTIDERMARRRSRTDWLDGFRQDIIYAARSLRGSPIVTGTIVLTLALGIGVNTAMFSLIDVVFLRQPAGVVHPERVHRMYSERIFANHSGPISWPGFDYAHYAAAVAALDGHGRAALYTRPDKAKIAQGDDAPLATRVFASASYFDVLGVRAALGRLYTASDDRLGDATNVAVVSDAFWHRELRGDPSVIGKAITLGKTKYSIVGVTQPDFTGVDLDAVDVWVPIATFRGGTVPWWTGFYANGFQVLVQLDPGFSADALENRLTPVFRQPQFIRGKSDSATVVKFGPVIAARGPGERQQEVQIATRILGVTIIVLLIACANVVNLLLARAVRRRREIAVRLAMGISRMRLIRLLLVESLLLSSLATVAAIFAAAWGGKLLRTMLLPDVQWASSPLSWRVLAFTLSTAVATGVFAGLIPALQSTDPDLANALKAGSREGSPQRSRLRSTLVAAQAALSVLLLVGAALFVKSLRNVRGLDLGYTTDQLVFAELQFEDSDKERNVRVAAALSELAARLRSAPGVEQVALASDQPMTDINFLTYFADGASQSNEALGTFLAVSPEFFTASGTRLLEGNGFSGVKGAREVVVNDAFVEALWPGQDAIGKCLRFEKRDAPCYAVTGVVQTARRDQLIESRKPQYYLSLNSMPTTMWTARTLVVRTAPGATIPVANEVRRTLRNSFPGGTPRITRMADALEQQYRPWRLGAMLFAIFGGLALIVATIGIYSSVSYGVSQRVHEFGVRVALGAGASDVMQHVIGQGLRTVTAGILLGVALTFAAGRLVASLLYNVSPSDPGAIIAVATLLVGVSILAAFSPAWRAARVDPMVALRAD